MKFYGTRNKGKKFLTKNKNTPQKTNIQNKTEQNETFEEFH